MATAGRAQTRVTSGAWRGRLIDTPRGGAVRPTTSLVRKALFDILGERVVGMRTVDLYAGTGAVTFEALSRGSGHATVVENDRTLLDLIRSTALRLGCADRVRVVGADVLLWLAASPRELREADLCFVDAPYRDDGLEGALDLLGASPPATVVCEHHRARRLPPTVGALHLARRAVYGTTHLTFYSRQTRSPGTEEGPRP